jgi:hypothetical protein
MTIDIIPLWELPVCPVAPQAEKDNTITNSAIPILIFFFIPNVLPNSQAELKLPCLSHITILYRKNRADKRKKRSGAHFFL